jgi:hypothetical protein
MKLWLRWSGARGSSSGGGGPEETLTQHLKRFRSDGGDDGSVGGAGGGSRQIQHVGIQVHQVSVDVDVCGGLKKGGNNSG